MINCYEFVLRDRLVDIMYGRVLQRAVDAVYATNTLVHVLVQVARRRGQRSSGTSATTPAFVSINFHTGQASARRLVLK